LLILKRPPGLGLDAAVQLGEEVGIMCLGIDVGGEALPSPIPNSFLPVHCYMFATAGTPMIENMMLENVASDRQSARARGRTDEADRQHGTPYPSDRLPASLAIGVRRPFLPQTVSAVTTLELTLVQKSVRGRRSIRLRPGRERVELHLACRVLSAFMLR
jgi:hypothetical protein